MKKCRQYIIDDSTVIKNQNYLLGGDHSVRVGMVREFVYVPKSRETRYIVEVMDRGRLRPMVCTRLSRFGGLFNFEEYNLRGFEPGKTNSNYGNFATSPGDTVLVACINGESTEGVILGCIKHFGREEVLPTDNSISYISEFNGIETIINALGEYRVTFKGLPTNVKELNKSPNGEPYPDPKYDVNVGYSCYQFDKNGSFTITDNSSKGNQFIKMDKPSGKIIISSGNTSLVIDKKEESYTITNKKVTFNTSDEWNLSTKKTTIKSTNLIEAEAKDIKTKGKWTQQGDMQITGNTKQTGNIDVTGNLTTTGKTSLAGGSFPLIYDIALTIGIGNLGAPVISSHTLLKTSMTKAT